MSNADPTSPGESRPDTSTDEHPQPWATRPSAVEMEARLRSLEDRLKIARHIRYAFLPLLVLTVLCVLFLGYVIIIGQESNNPTATMAFASSVQVVFGMATGYVCVFIGLMMTWFGIEAAYSLDGAVDTGGMKGDLALKSASPGLLFALGGMILIAVSLYKPIIYEETGNRPVRIGPTSQDSKKGGLQGPTPSLPPPIDDPIPQKK